MPPIRVLDIETKLSMEKCALARREAEKLRRQEDFKVVHDYFVSTCDRSRRVIQDLEKQLIVARKKLEQGSEWSDEDLTYNWENGLVQYQYFEEEHTARRLQLAYIATRSRVTVAPTLALISAQIAAGLYNNPAKWLRWKASSKSRYFPRKATAAQEYATPNTYSTIEEEIEWQDEAFLDDSMSEMIEHPGELSPTILAQNARASRTAFRQGMAARGSAAGSSMIHVEYLNKLAPRNNAQHLMENASSMPGVRGKAVRRSATSRSAAGSFKGFSERGEVLNELPPSSDVWDTLENDSSISGGRGKVVRRSATNRSAAGSSMVHSDLVDFPNELSSSTNAQRVAGNASSLSGVLGNGARSSRTETHGLQSSPYPFSRAYEGVPTTTGYDGSPRVVKVSENDEQGNQIMPVTEPPRATIQSVAIQTLYPQLFRLEFDCDERTKRIFEMPETRQLDLAKDKSFSLDDLTFRYETHRLEAALGQIRGVVARKPCGHCKSKTSKGPFATCVVVPGEFYGACCNCLSEHPMGQGDECTLYEDISIPGQKTKAQLKAEAKAKHPLRAASLALRSHFPKLRSMKSLPAEHLKEANPQSAAASQRQAERIWAAYPRGF